VVGAHAILTRGEAVYQDHGKGKGVKAPQRHPDSPIYPLLLQKDDPLLLGMGVLQGIDEGNGKTLGPGLTHNRLG